jgi:DNA-binding SARP family transcriptional activator
VRLAGPFGVQGGGVQPGGAGAGKARRLLVLLAVERPGLVSTDRIIKVLRDGVPPRRPAENVATLVSRLRMALGAGAVEGGRNGYRLGREPAVRVDLDEAVRLVGESRRRLAEGTPTLATAAATAALEVLGNVGVLVDEPDADWVRRARAEGAALLRAVRLVAATAACQAGDPGAARAAAEAAVAADPLDEAAHRLLMTAHQLAGEPSRALADFERPRWLASESDTSNRRQASTTSRWSRPYGRWTRSSPPTS